MSSELTQVSHPDLPGLIGLGDPMLHRNEHQHPESASHLEPQQPSPGQIAYATAENRELRAEVDRLRADRDVLLDRQRQVMDLLGTRAPSASSTTSATSSTSGSCSRRSADLTEE